jgi:protein-disulfide isomerase
MKTHNIMKPWYKKWWGIILIILGVFLLAFILSFSWAVYSRVSEIRNEQFTQAQQGYLESLVPAYSPKQGPDNAAITIVEFSDFECPFCAQSMPILEDVLQEYSGLVRFVYRHMPIDELHPNAWKASIASTCANEQDAFWSYHDRLFLEQNDLSKTNLFTIAENMNFDMSAFTNCFDSEKYSYQVRKDMNDGAELGLEGTPTFYINGELVSGVLNFDQWKIILDAFLLKEE